MTWKVKFVRASAKQLGIFMCKIKGHLLLLSAYYRVS